MFGEYVASCLFALLKWCDEIYHDFYCQVNCSQSVTVPQPT